MAVAEASKAAGSSSNVASKRADRAGKRCEALLDEALNLTFPASDPVAVDFAVAARDRQIDELAFAAGFQRAQQRRQQLEPFRAAALERENKRLRKALDKKRRRPKSQRVTDTSIMSAWESASSEPSRTRVSATRAKLELDGAPISDQALRKRLDRLGLVQIQPKKVVPRVG